jgi:ArsR family transcriptional regulator
MYSYFHKYGDMKKSAVVVALGALAQETRLDIFRLLVQKGPEGMPAGEISSRLALPSPTLSFHLNQLRFAGLLTSRRASRSIIYSANFKAMTDLVGYLTENCCGGRPELCTPSASGCGPACAPEPITIGSKKNTR